MAEHRKPNHSEVDALPGFPPQVDAQIFPLFARASARVVELAPGDALWMPADWWHWVFTDTPGEPHGLALAVNFWHEGAGPDEPVLLPGRYAAWPALREWDLDVLAERFTVRTYISGALSTSPGLSPVLRPRWSPPVQPRLYRAEYLHEVRELVQRHPALHHQAIVSFNADCGVLGDIELPDEAARDWQRVNANIVSSASIPPYVLDRSNLWINVGQGQSGLHFDGYPNMLVQLRGRKRLLLYPPSDSAWLYPAQLLTRSPTSLQRLLQRPEPSTVNAG